MASVLRHRCETWESPRPLLAIFSSTFIPLTRSGFPLSERGRAFSSSAPQLWETALLPSTSKPGRGAETPCWRRKRTTSQPHSAPKTWCGWRSGSLVGWHLCSLVGAPEGGTLKGWLEGAGRARVGVSKWGENQGPPAGCLLFNCCPFNLLKNALGLRPAPPTVWTELSEFQEAISANSPLFLPEEPPSPPRVTLWKRGQ